MLRFDPLVVAEQLTLIEESLLVELEPRELLQNAWSKSNKDERAPNVLRIIANFNRVSYFVTTFVVSGATTEERNKRMQFWGEVLKHCIALNNISTGMAISSSFQVCVGASDYVVVCAALWVAVPLTFGQSVPMHRLLKRHLLEIKTSTQKSLDALTELMRGNKTGYRRKMEVFLSSGEPAIPYLAVHLSDLTFLEDGNPNFVDDLINMQKRHLIGKQIGPLEKLQSRPYTNFQSDPALQAYLRAVEGYQETALDHLVEKLIADVADGAGGDDAPATGWALLCDRRVRARGCSQSLAGHGAYKTLTNRSDMMAMLEAEAQKTGDARLQSWKDWFLRFSETGPEFLATWRGSRAWEFTLLNLLQRPPAKRELELFLDLFGKMLPGAAPYLPAAVTSLVDAGRTEPTEELQEQLVACLVGLKLPALDALSAKPVSTTESELRGVPASDITAQLRKDRSSLAIVQSAILLPPNFALADAKAVARDLGERVPVLRQEMAQYEAERNELQAEESASSVGLTEKMDALSTRLESLLMRQKELRAMLEDVNKQIGEAEAVRKELIKDCKWLPWRCSTCRCSDAQR